MRTVFSNSGCCEGINAHSPVRNQSVSIKTRTGAREGRFRSSRTTYTWMVSTGSSSTWYSPLLLLLELRGVVEKDHTLILNVQDNVYFSISVHVLEFSGDGNWSALSE